MGTATATQSTAVQTRELMITRRGMANLMTGSFPNPDGPEPNPHGPFGPVSHDWLAWRSAGDARKMIDQCFAQYQMGQAGGEMSEKMLAVVLSNISSFVDGYCGTPPLRPWPPRRDVTKLRPVDLLVAGAQFEKVAELMPDHPLQASFSSAADRLFAAGLQGLER
jgi:hypothetical protein